MFNSLINFSFLFSLSILLALMNFDFQEVIFSLLLLKVLQQTINKRKEMRPFMVSI